MFIVNIQPHFQKSWDILQNAIQTTIFDLILSDLYLKGTSDALFPQADMII